jgi:hypothetical protein
MELDAHPEFRRRRSQIPRGTSGKVRQHLGDLFRSEHRRSGCRNRHCHAGLGIGLDGDPIFAGCQRGENDPSVHNFHAKGVTRVEVQPSSDRARDHHLTVGRKGSPHSKLILQYGCEFATRLWSAGTCQSKPFSM